MLLKQEMFIATQTILIGCAQYQENAMGKISVILLVLCVFLFTGCITESSKEPMEPQTREALLIIPSHDVQDDELREAQSALENAGAIVTVASIEGEDVTGMLGGLFTPDIKISDAIESDYELVACIGGTGSFDLWENQEIISLVTEFYNHDKTVAAICAAPGILANAGLLNNIEATCFPYEPISDLLTSKGAIYVDREVVISGKIITGNGPDAAKAFGAALAEAL